MEKEQIIEILQSIINELKENKNDYIVTLEITPVVCDREIKSGRTVEYVKFERTLHINDLYVREIYLD